MSFSLLFEDFSLNRETVLSLQLVLPPLISLYLDQLPQIEAKLISSDNTARIFATEEKARLIKLLKAQLSLKYSYFYDEHLKQLLADSNTAQAKNAQETTAKLEKNKMWSDFVAWNKQNHTQSKALRDFVTMVNNLRLDILWITWFLSSTMSVYTAGAGFDSLRYTLNSFNAFVGNLSYIDYILRLACEIHTLLSAVYFRSDAMDENDDPADPHYGLTNQDRLLYQLRDSKHVIGNEMVWGMVNGSYFYLFFRKDRLPGSELITYYDVGAYLTVLSFLFDYLGAQQRHAEAEDRYVALIRVIEAAKNDTVANPNTAQFILENEEKLSLNARFATLESKAELYYAAALFLFNLLGFSGLYPVLFLPDAVTNWSNLAGSVCCVVANILFCLYMSHLKIEKMEAENQAGCHTEINRLRWEEGSKSILKTVTPITLVVSAHFLSLSAAIGVTIAVTIGILIMTGSVFEAPKREDNAQSPDYVAVSNAQQALI